MRMRELSAPGLLLCLLALPLGAEERWITVHGGGNRFVVNALRADLTQEVLLWADSAVRHLERQTGLRIPFGDHRPLVFVFHPSFPELRLIDQGRGPARVQEIQGPGGKEMDGARLADLLVRALLRRSLEPEEGREAAEVPDWLVRGLAADLLPGGAAVYSPPGIERWRERRLPPPYTVTRSAAPAGERTVDFWTVRYLFRPENDRTEIWREIKLRGELSAGAWVRISPGIHTLRELQIHWDAWMARRDLAEPGGDAAFEARLAEMTRIRPALFGVNDPGVRHRVFSLEELADHADAPWLRQVLPGWRVRMSQLRFAQPRDRLDRMDVLLRAMERLDAALALRGRARVRELERFRAELAEIRAPAPPAGR
jgi:hypothetical protein